MATNLIGDGISCQEEFNRDKTCIFGDESNVSLCGSANGATSRSAWHRAAIGTRKEDEGPENRMYWEQKVEYAALSDVGFRRRNNQDSYAVQIAPDREHWN